MVVSDLRQRVRDRSVLIFGIVVPLALMGVLNLALGGLLEGDLDAVDVAVVAPAGDPLASELTQILGSLDDPAVTVTEASVDDARRLVERGEVGLAVVFPDGFAGAVFTGQRPEVRVIEGESTGVEEDVVVAVTESVLERFTAGAQAAAAGVGAGLPPDEMGRLIEAVASADPMIDLAVGTTASEQLGPAAALVAGQSGLFLMFTVGFGVLGLLAEREQGTLARLRSMPMRPEKIVLAKALVSVVLGVLATSVLLAAGAVLFDASFGSVPAVAALVLAAVAATTSLMFIVARVTRTAEQAGAAQSILAIVLGIAGGAFLPVNASGLVGRLLDLNPVSAFIHGLGITGGGGGLTDIGRPLAVLVGFAIASMVAARLLPDRGAGA